MNSTERFILARLFIILVLLFMGCQSKNELSENQSEERGRKSKSYVKIIMTQYVAPNSRNVNLLPAPPEGNSFLTVGAAYNSDSLRVLLDTLSELVDLSALSGTPTDSAYITSIVKGENMLKLNKQSMAIAKVIRPWTSLDSIKSKGKEYVISQFFKENGYQKKNLNPEEQANLIDTLSDWGILVYWDDYIGTYRIVDSAQEKE